jgi:putative solute:sodium symporter small subunit
MSETPENAGRANGVPDIAFDPPSHARLARHWRRTRLLTGGLACVWFCATFGVGFFARELERFHFFGWPLSYYMGAQGSLIVFLLIIGAYALVMRRFDREASGGLGESSGEPR